MGKFLKEVKMAITNLQVPLINSTAKERVINFQCLLAKTIMPHLLTMPTKAKKLIRINLIRLKISMLLKTATTTTNHSLKFL